MNPHAHFVRCPPRGLCLPWGGPSGDNMIRSLWIAKTGLDAQQTQLDVIANNLANVSTNGFKRSRAVFEDLLYQTLRQPGAQSTQQTTIPSGRPPLTITSFNGAGDPFHREPSRCSAWSEGGPFPAATPQSRDK